MSRPTDHHLGSVEAAKHVTEALEAHAGAAIVLVVDGPDELVGSRIVAVGAAPEPELLGSAGAPEALRSLALQGLEGEAPEGVHEIAGETPLRVYLEVHRPSPELVVVGAGHIAQPLTKLGAMLGLRVTVIDDRPDFATAERFPDASVVRSVNFQDPFADIPVHGGTHVVLVTRGHKYDYEALRKLLVAPTEPAYIGMIGSRRRVRATFAQLVKEDFDRDRLRRVRAPVGLDLGSETPAEIAVAVAAEIIMILRGGSGAPLSDQVRVLDRFFADDDPAGDEEGRR